MNSFTFWITAKSGVFTSALATRAQAVERELSCLGLPAFLSRAEVWPWQQGEASITSCFGTCDQSAWYRSWQTCCVSGLFLVCHSTAAGQWLAAHRTLRSASFPPRVHPPKPENKSIAVRMGSPAGCARGVVLRWPLPLNGLDHDKARYLR